MGADRNPSRWHASPFQTRETWTSHPVEQVNWWECETALARLGLVLPTEAQWEYAARGGTEEPWWCGERQDLAWAENLVDESFLLIQNELVKVEKWNDGHGVHAPVGCFEPNPFGFFDILGNVSEWTLDWESHYSNGHRPGDGALLGRSQRSNGIYAKISRGGSYRVAATWSRSAHRSGRQPEYRDSTIGVRPARMIGW